MVAFLTLLSNRSADPRQVITDWQNSENARTAFGRKVRIVQADPYLARQAAKRKFEQDLTDRAERELEGGKPVAAARFEEPAGRDPNFRALLAQAAAQVVRELRVCTERGLIEADAAVDALAAWLVVGKFAKSQTLPWLDRMVLIAEGRTQTIIEAAREARKQQRRAA